MKLVPLPQVTQEIVDRLAKPLNVYLYVGPYVEPEKPEVRPFFPTSFPVLGCAGAFIACFDGVDDSRSMSGSRYLRGVIPGYNAQHLRPVPSLFLVWDSPTDNGLLCFIGYGVEI